MTGAKSIHIEFYCPYHYESKDVEAMPFGADAPILILTTLQSDIQAA
jgi:hypothetical protein